MASPEVTAALKLRDDMSPGLKRAEGNVHGFSGFVQQAGATMAGFLGASAVINGVSAAFNFAKDAAFGMNAKLETSTLQFETLMGDADKAKTHVEMLFKFAKDTPFETQPILDASRLLQTFGGAALNTKANLTKFGDAAAATNAPIQEVSFWMGRAYAAIQAGKPFGEARMRLTELGLMTPQVSMKLEALEKSGGSVSEKWKTLSSSFDRFDGAMKKQSGTWNGLMSSLSDAMNITAAGALKPFFEMAEGGLQKLVDFLSSDTVAAAGAAFASVLSGGLGQVMDIIGKGVGFVADIVASFQQFNEHLATTASVGDRVVGILGSVVAAFGVAPETVEGVGEALGRLVDTYKAGLEPVFNDLVDLWQTAIVPAFDQLREGLLKLEPRFTVMVERVRPFLAILMMLAERYLANVIQGLKVVLPAAINVVVGAFGLVIDIISGVAQTFTDLWTLVDDIFHGRWSKVWDDVVTLVTNMKGNFDKILGDLAKIVLGFFGDIVDGIVGSKGSIPKFVKDVQGKFTELFAWLSGLIPSAMQGVGDLFSGFGTTLKGIWDGFVLLIETAATAFWERPVYWITRMVLFVPGLLFQLMEQVQKWGLDLIGWAVKVGTEFLGNMVAFFTQLPGNIGKFLADIIGRISKWAKDTLTFAIRLGLDFTATIIGFLIKLPGQFTTWLATTVTAIGDALKDFVAKAKSLGQGVWNAIAGFKWSSLGTDLIEGIRGGIWSGLQSLLKVIGGWSRQVIDAFKVAFGIHSPSVPMQEMGRDITAGFQMGIVNSWGALQDVVGRLALPSPKPPAPPADLWQLLVAQFKNLPADIQRAIGRVDGALSGTGAELLGGLHVGIQANWEPMLVQIQELLTALPRSLRVGSALGLGRAFVVSLLGGVQSGWPTLRTAIANLNLGRPRDLEGMITAFADRFSGLPQEVIAAMGRLTGSLSGAGSDLVEGLILGLRDRWATLVNWLGGQITLLLRPLQTTLSLRAGRQMGLEFTNGLRLGLSAGLPGLRTALAGVNLGAPLGFAPALAGARGSALRSAQPQVTELHLHIDTFVGDGPAIDALTNKITQRLHFAPGT